MIDKTRGLMQEFKSFAVKGNALELAIAVVVGTAFSGIVNSLVADIITPLLGLFTNSVDFKTLVWTVRPDLVIKYGSFLQAVFNFVIISAAVFFVFKSISSMRKRLWARHAQEQEAPHEKPPQERLLEEIRDLLKEKK